MTDSHGEHTFADTATVVVRAGPRVASIERDTTQTGLAYVVTFDMAVTGVDAGDFAVNTSGTITGAGVATVTGSGDTYVVTLEAVTGWGTLELDVVDDDTIVNLLGVPLGGDGAGNGDFYGPTFMPAVTVKASEIVPGSGPGGAWAEGDEVTLDLGTDCLDLPEGTVWTVDWGDGSDPVTGSSSTVSYVYTTGDGSYDVTVEAVAPDGTVLYSDFVAVAVVPREPTDLEAGVDPFGKLMLTWSEDSALVDCFDVYVAEGDGGGGGGNFARYSAMMGQTMNGLQGEDLTAEGYVLWASGIGAGERSFDLSELGSGTHRLALVARNAGGESAAATLTVTRVGEAPGTMPGNTGVDLGFPVNFYGYHTSEAYVYANGLIALNTWTLERAEQPIAEYEWPLIAPFWASVDAWPRYEGDTSGGMISFGWEEAYADPADGGAMHPAFGVHWDGVEYWNRTAEGHVALRDTFAVHLVDRSDVGPGDFDIVFEYGDMGWDTGDIDAWNPDGLPARAGWTNGSGRAGTYYELPGSGEGGGLIDGETSVANTVYCKEVRNAQPHLKVQDASQAANWTTDVNKGVMGVVADAAGAATLGLSLTNDSGVPLGDGYSYGVLDGLGYAQVLKWEDSVPVYWLPLAAEGVTDYTTSQAGQYTIMVTSAKDPGVALKVNYYLARLDIQWTGVTADNIRCIGSDVPLGSGANIGGRSVEIYTGQRIQFRAVCSLPAVKLAHWSKNRAWGGNFVEDYLVEKTSGHVRNATDSDTTKVVPVSSSDLFGLEPMHGSQPFHVYGVTDNLGQVFQVQVQAWVGTQIVTFWNSVTLNIHKPGKSMWSGPGLPGDPDLFKVKGYLQAPSMNYDGSNWWLITDVHCNTSVPTVERVDYEGTISWVQLVNVYQSTGKNTNDTWKLDGSYPYNDVPGDPDFDDVPGTGAHWWNSDLQMNFYAHDWLMWTPPGSDSIAVPIQDWTWSVETTAQKFGAPVGWRVTFGVMRVNGGAVAAGAAFADIEGADTSDFPTWTSILPK